MAQKKKLALDLEPGRLDAQKEMNKQKWDSIKGMFSQAGQGIANLTSDPRRLAYLALTAGGTAGLVYGLKLGFKQLERYLNRPRLVRETSRKGLFGKQSSGPLFSDMVLEPAVKNKLRAVMLSATQAYLHGTNLPNVGLFGPPGTGKTMFIEALARESGMTYAKMTGGDVSALLSSGGQNVAVTEIHKLFDWLETHGPAILLVDEADAFLRSGRDGQLSEGLSAAINAFLSRTGSSSRRVMVVFATNYPQALDGAVKNRVSTWVRVGRPGRDERHQMLNMLIGEMVSGGIGKNRIPVTLDTSVDLPAIAQRLDGFAGRDIKMKVIDSLEREMIAREQFNITPDLMDEVIEGVLDQEQVLAKWVNGARPDFNGIAQAVEKREVAPTV